MRRTPANKFAYLFGRMLGGIRRSEAQADGFLGMDLVFIFPIHLRWMPPKTISLAKHAASCAYG